MPVYMIQAGGPTGPVKIGYGDAQGRLTDCQVGNHLELQIIRLFEGGEPEEAEMHVRFEDLWIRGEWHNFSRAMLGNVGLIEIVEPAGLSSCAPSDEQSSNNDLNFRLRQSRITQEAAARATGVTQSEFSRWCRNERSIPPHQALKIQRALDIPLHALRPDLWPEPPTPIADTVREAA